MTMSFLGIPVDGDIIRHEDQAAQRPLEELRPVLQSVLDDELVTAFGWLQYTPYFNDGDPCVFTVHGTWFRTTADSDDLSLHDLALDCHPVLADRRWNSQEQRADDIELAPDTAALRAKCKALEAAVEGGAFHQVLLEAFGDHAEITVRRDGITVGLHKHD